MTESLMMDNFQEKIIACLFDEDYLPNPNKRECSPSMPPSEPTINQRLRRFIKSIFYFTPIFLLISFSFSEMKADKFIQKMKKKTK